MCTLYRRIDLKAAVKTGYRAARSVVFAAILFVVGFVACLYVMLSLPWVQQKVLEVACREVSTLLGGTVDAKRLSITLFDEVVLHDVSLTSPSGERCIEIGTLGAGIDLGRLFWDRKIEITYAEIIGLKGNLNQKEEGGPLNIQFMIDALAPKDKNKPPTKFDLRIRTVVIRKSALTFDRMWVPAQSDSCKLDFNHLHINDLAIDMSVPRLRNDDFEFDLRRVSFTTPEGLNLTRLSCVAEVSPTRLALRDFSLRTPGTFITVSDTDILPKGGYKGIVDALRDGEYDMTLTALPLTPSDFGSLFVQLREFKSPLSLKLEAHGNMQGVRIGNLSLRDMGANDLALSLKGEVYGLAHPADIRAGIDDMDLRVSARLLQRIVSLLPMGELPRKIVTNCGDINLQLTGFADMSQGVAHGDLRVATSAGALQLKDIRGDGLRGKNVTLALNAVTGGFDVGRLAGISDIGRAAFDIEADVHLGGKIPDGMVNAAIDYVELRGRRVDTIDLFATKEGKDMSLQFDVDDDELAMGLEAMGVLDGEDSTLTLEGMIEHFIPSDIGVLPQYPGYNLTGGVKADISGSNADNLTGRVEVSDLAFTSAGNKSVRLRHLLLESDRDPEGGRDISLNSDLLDGYMAGDFNFAGIVPAVRCMLATVIPSIIDCGGKSLDQLDTAFDFNLTLKADHEVLDFFTLPMRPLTDVVINGTVDVPGGMADLSVDAPYLQQGKNKLVRDTRMRAVIDTERRTASVGLSTQFPVKFGEMTLGLTADAHDDNLHTDLSWGLPDTEMMSGKMTLDADFARNPLDRSMDLGVRISPSEFVMNGARWHIAGGNISFGGKRLDVDNLMVSHGDQFVNIAGVASEMPEDTLRVRLANIDLSYIFDTLNINYVNFGGVATGQVSASSLFTPALSAATDTLHVSGLRYNGALLGDAELKSRFDIAEKMVSIGADISEGGRRRALLDGGIWVTRDSLSFDVDAHKINVEFLQPFMSAFCGGVEGRASGRAKLYGTFKDIDLIGRLKADTLRMKLDFTNTWYSGSDSVFLDPGHITIPHFRLYDRDGHSGTFSGTLTHRYFHDPVFDFKLRDARDLLCYDTNARLNPDWYGTVYGTGSASIQGRPGLVGINIDMSTCPRTEFTLVLNDTQAAEEYRFLSFSDRRKEEIEASVPDTVPDFLKRFRKKVEQEEGDPTNVVLDIRATVNPEALLTLVMDPAGGDKITARGSGAMQMEYDLESNEMKMFGRYTLDEGNYRFSLQDIILKDFNIRQGSAISFNGDPMNANLDITATYRVNTNLSDLDKSFSTDRDLNRTNVPVDAVLMVQGPMTTPDISFDIDLPTLTEDVGRKVKSLISTNDMMSRQIIYLLALNRFYTPEYTGASSNSGAEFSALASSTLSSQLSNVLSNLTDKLTVSPSFRTDKGDFSDMEVDLALSSRLLNNRLLINGNFGYRDRSTSSTTFVGDFDIEYLLNASGNLRLKAYNHFNDQNYYLRSALTTQGIGVVVRKEFNHILSFLRKRKKKTSPSQTEDPDLQTAPSAAKKTEDNDVQTDSLTRNADEGKQTTGD